MLAAESGFVSLASRLRPNVAAPAFVAEPPPVLEPPPREPPELDALLREIRLFHAALADAFDVALAEVVRELTLVVLGRELLLAPPELTAVVARILADHPAATPLRVRAAAADRDRLLAWAPPTLPVERDDTLASGDVVVEFADVAVDARLGVRLASVLDSWS